MPHFVEKGFDSLTGHTNQIDMSRDELNKAMGEYNLTPSNNLGASQTDTNKMEGGALPNITSPSILSQAQSLADAVYGTKKSKPNMALASLLYFSKLAEESSKPGATLLGAAGTAFQSPSAYLLQEKETQRKQDQAKASLVAGLVPTIAKASKTTDKDPKFYVLKEDVAGIGVEGDAIPYDATEFAALDPKIKIKFLPYEKQSTATFPKTFVINKDIEEWKNANPNLTNKIYEIDGKNVIDLSATEASNTENINLLPSTTTKAPKVVGSGQTAVYMNEADAKELLIGLGLPETNVNFERILGEITTDDPKLLGKPLIVGGQYQDLVPFVGDGENITNIFISPSKSGSVPPFTSYTKKRLDIIAKLKTDFISKSFEVLPNVDRALNTLLTGKVETGALTSFLFPLRRILGQAFQTVDPSIAGLESIESISFALAPKMRPAGSGSTSDLEFKAYQKAIVDISNTTLANYISLYAFKKMTENSLKLSELEENLLSSGKYRDTIEINKILRQQDSGIFEKYTGDLDDQEAIMSWYNSLPSGSVFINNNMFDTNSVYIVKDAPSIFGTGVK